MEKESLALCHLSKYHLFHFCHPCSKFEECITYYNSLKPKPIQSNPITHPQNMRTSSKIPTGSYLGCLVLLLSALALLLLASVANAKKPATWEKVPLVTAGLPGDRAGQAAVTVGHDVYLFGGTTIDYKRELNTAHFNDLHRLDTRDNSLELVVPSSSVGPSPREHSILVASNDKQDLYLVGGVYLDPYETSIDFTTTAFFNEVWKFHLKTRTWSLVELAQGSPVPSGRAGARGFLNKDKIYVIFGYDPQFRNEVWTFDIKSRRWALVPSGGVPIQGRTNVAMAYDSAKELAYVYGGLGMNAQYQFVKYNDLYTYDVKRNVWTLVESDSLSPERAHGTLSLVKGSLVHFGGDMPGGLPGGVCNSPHGDNVSDDTLVRDAKRLSSSPWELQGKSKSHNHPPPLQYHTTAVVKDYIYVFGGYSVFDHEGGGCQVYNGDIFRYGPL